MSTELLQKSTTIDLAELKRLFGPSPVLSTEIDEAYDAILTRFMECINPRDFLVQMLIKDLADTTWDIMRYTRHKTWTIQRKYRQHVEFQETRKKLRAQRQAALAEKVPQTGRPATQVERVDELEAIVDSSVHDLDEILNRKPEELDHARALESGIDYFERLDRLISIAMARRNDIFEQIALYGATLGQHLRRASDEIIDGEFSETKQGSPSLIPSGEQQ